MFEDTELQTKKIDYLNKVTVTNHNSKKSSIHTFLKANKQSNKDTYLTPHASDSGNEQEYYVVTPEDETQMRKNS